jgi:hypothetical protein
VGLGDRETAERVARDETGASRLAVPRLAVFLRSAKIRKKKKKQKFG